ncbi:TPA: pheST operon leader peptide PheM [Kluyvera intermedia]|uniref:pheST attenuator peptide n=1 Tax=Kluyvera intermedia TaxID=61648 RepID=A0A9P3T656_KLUIN|nr:pheST operon leader peptide PheM [Kluyvera intermedia]HAT2513944.1 pheST operon leader peptide PheM [Kluyvera intermedia]HAT2602045.1 pheST operon leader peptide PheM [Kluyvera intermedia]HAT2607945.1 pheST operon leader peptide PheM [Kluyvera intermedia]HAT2678909.1 pheST operon leader peptide PheM [Kluyvera intermedia]
MIDFFPVSPFNKGNPLFTTQGNASMNAAIFRFFFYFST